MSKHTEPVGVVPNVEIPEVDGGLPGEEHAVQPDASEMARKIGFIPTEEDRELYRQRYLLARPAAVIGRAFGLAAGTVRNRACSTRNYLAMRQFELSTAVEVDTLAEELLEVHASWEEAMQAWDQSKQPRVTSCAIRDHRQKAEGERDKHGEPVLTKVTKVEQCGQPRFLDMARKLRGEKRIVRQLIRETQERDRRAADPEAAAKQDALGRVMYERACNEEKRREDEEYIKKLQENSINNTPEFKALMKELKEEHRRRMEEEVDIEFCRVMDYNIQLAKEREAAEAAAAAAAAIIAANGEEGEPCDAGQPCDASEPRASATGGAAVEAASVETKSAAEESSPVAAAAPELTPPVADAQGSEVGAQGSGTDIPDAATQAAVRARAAAAIEARKERIDQWFLPVSPEEEAQLERLDRAAEAYEQCLIETVPGYVPAPDPFAYDDSGDDFDIDIDTWQESDDAPPDGPPPHDPPPAAGPPSVT